MHYKNHREAKVGDLVIGMTYNKPGIQVGRVKSIKTSQNPEEVKICNVVLELPTISFGRPETDYTQCDWLLLAEDCYHFVIGVAFSPNDQDYMAKIMNFNKCHAPIEELKPSDRPVRVVKG